MNLIIFVLACAGMSNIIIESYVFQRLRDWLKEKLPKCLHLFFTDYSLVGLYSGLLLGWILIGHTVPLLIGSALAGSFIADCIANIFVYLQVNSIIDLEEK